MTSEKRSKLLEQAQAAARGGDIERAVEICNRLVEQDLDDLGSLNVLASIYGHAGRPDEAISLCRKIIRIDGSSVRARSNLASALRMKGDVSEAILVSQELISIAPDEPSGYVNLGLAFLARKDYSEAIPNLERVARMQPKAAFSQWILGSALLEAGRLEEADRTLQKAMSLAADDRNVLSALARVKTELKKPDEAVAPLRRLIRTDPREIIFRMLLAKALGDSGDPLQAEEVLSNAARDFPESAEPLTALAMRLQEVGRFDESQVLLRRSIELNPNQGYAFWGLVQGHKLSAGDEDLIREIEAVLLRAGLTVDDRRYLHFALGKSYDDLKQPALAMPHFDAANRFAEQENPADRQFVPGRYREIFSDTIRLFSKEAIARLSSSSIPDDRPIFIVGMMRSGTTLVDQILTSHSLVCGAGELEFWFDRVRKEGTVRHQDPNSDSARDRATRYINLLNRLCPNSPRVTDKMPQNFTVLGLIHALLPNAKIIHCRRNPIDTCLSIYMNPYRVSPDYAHRFEHLVEFYREYERLMSYWRQVIPETSMMEVVYEDLVDSQEQTTRRLVEFCGLEWEQACLRHQDNDRRILTSSVWQARQPVYKSSVARWRNYEPWLGPLRELLP
jgi:tetratricopeptide (TPR) repeat protein